MISGHTADPVLKLRVAKQNVDSIAVPAKGNAYFSYFVQFPFKISNVRLTTFSDSLDINHVVVGNIMLAMFSKRIPVCDAGTRILIVVDNLGLVELSTGVEIEGIELEV
jgi:hypothetical protein